MRACVRACVCGGGGMTVDACTSRLPQWALTDLITPPQNCSCRLSSHHRAGHCRSNPWPTRCHRPSAPCCAHRLPRSLGRLRARPMDGTPLVATMGWRGGCVCVCVRERERERERQREGEDKGTLAVVCECLSAGALVRYWCGCECQGDGMSERTWVCLRGYRVYGWV